MQQQQPQDQPAHLLSTASESGTQQAADQQQQEQQQEQQQVQMPGAQLAQEAKAAVEQPRRAKFGTYPPQCAAAVTAEAGTQPVEQRCCCACPGSAVPWARARATPASVCSPWGQQAPAAAAGQLSRSRIQGDIP